MQKLLRALLALAILALPLAAATPAAALTAEAACDGSPISPQWSPLNEYFRPDASVIPPALRSFDFTCASRTVGDEGGATINFAYDLLFLDFPLARLADLLASIEADGWTYQNESRFADLGDGLAPFDADAAAVRDLPASTSLVQAAASDERLDTLGFEWYDGTPTHQFWEGFTAPHLFVRVLISSPFATTGIDDPSVLSTLRTISEALPSPTQTAVICGAAVLLTVVVGWPGALLGGVISSRYDQLFGWTEKGLPKRIRTALKKTQPRWLVWIGFVAAAIVAGFVDPSYGFNLMSLRMLASAFLGFVVFNIIGWAIVRRVAMRLQPDSKPVVNFRWGSLIIVLAAVLIARVLEFQPGVIFGLVAGLTYAVTLVASRKAVVVLVGTAFALAVALIAWVVFSLLSPVTGTNPVLLFVTEFFSGVTIEGISSLPLALLPLTALDGGDLFGWKKWVWGLAYILGLAAFMLVLLTVPGTFSVFPGDFARWLILFAIYAVVAIGAWAIHGALKRRKDRKDAAKAPAAAT